MMNDVDDMIVCHVADYDFPVIRSRPYSVAKLFLCRF
jgi:hypothetical protein